MNNIIILILLLIQLIIPGCATVSKRDIVKETPGTMGISSRWLRHYPGSFSGDKKEIAVEIVRKLRTICSPVEWEAVRLLGGRNLASFSIANECSGCQLERNYMQKFNGHAEDLKSIIELVLMEIPPSSKSLEYQGDLSIQLTYLDDDYSAGEKIVFGTNLILNLGSVFILGAVIPVLNEPVIIDVTCEINRTNGETLRANGVGSGSIHGLTSILYDKLFKKGFIYSFAEALKVASSNLASHNFILLR